MAKIDTLEVTLEELQAFTEEDYPAREDTVFDSVIVVPVDRIHDSGYRCMKFVLLQDGNVVGVRGGFSDVIHINGIGGYGRWYRRVPGVVKPVGWSIDCLPCGVLRLFGHKKMTTDEWTGSDFSVYSTSTEIGGKQDNARRD